MAWCLCNHSSAERVSNCESNLPFTWYQYFFTQCRALLVYIGMFLLPVHLTVDWDFPISKTILDRGAIVGLMVLLSLVAAAWRLPIAILYAIPVLFGLSHGFANGTAISADIKAYLFIPGVGLAGLMVAAYGMIATDFLLRRKANWMQIAVRVAGSWIAAIGILVLATSGRAINSAIARPVSPSVRVTGNRSRISPQTGTW